MKYELMLQEGLATIEVPETLNADDAERICALVRSVPKPGARRYRFSFGDKARVVAELNSLDEAVGFIKAIGEHEAVGPRDLHNEALLSLKAVAPGAPTLVEEQRAEASSPSLTWCGVDRRRR